MTGQSGGRGLFLIPRTTKAAPRVFPRVLVRPVMQSVAALARSEMQTEARIEVVAEGGGAQRSLLSGGSVLHRHEQHQPQIETVARLLAGGVAGAVSKTCTAPLARLTILLQGPWYFSEKFSWFDHCGWVLLSNSPQPHLGECWLFWMVSGRPYRKEGLHSTWVRSDFWQVQGMHSDVATLRKASIWREASRVVYEEGFRAFWKGNLLLQLIPGLSRHRNSEGADACVRLLGGGLAGITAASITYPLDLVRTRLAAQVSYNLVGSKLLQTNTVYYRGISHALYAICRDEGIKGLYKGLGATLLGVGPSLAISFSVYETLRSHWQLKRPHDSAVLVSLASGSLSGIASSTVTFPLDLVRRRKQLEGAAGRSRVYTTGLFGTFRHILRTEGVRGLYRGILPEYYKVVPGVGIAFMTFEALKSCLSGSPNDR
ncbi:Mitochondrial substrate carrier family protein [Musa troglodytarum]|uniref:Mitochondrial substrate carrier family protein n=1 Tax=Musa troglodytarum TaxID=320322 RepID=A0A9E7I3X0_9LILI|nr:Mitochondrial substrate carrier family protein [Musa troglodytarum]